MSASYGTWNERCGLSSWRELDYHNIILYLIFFIFGLSSYVLNPSNQIHPSIIRVIVLSTAFVIISKIQKKRHKSNIRTRDLFLVISYFIKVRSTKVTSHYTNFTCHVKVMSSQLFTFPDFTCFFTYQALYKGANIPIHSRSVN